MQEKKHHIHWEQDWLEGKISSQEAAKHAADPEHFEVLSKFVEQSASLGVLEKTTKDEAWRRIEEKIAEAPKTKVVSINRRYWLTGVAASFILAISAFFLLDRNSGIVDVHTALAETRIIYLPDSSVIHLNAETDVSYSKKDWKEERVVELSGEAFFEVKRGSNFSVITEKGKVEVLGTSFNVRSRGDMMSVACKTGKVRVTAIDSDGQIVLTPGLKTQVKRGILTESVDTKIEDIDSWRSGQYFLESTSIQEGFEELERIFNVKVVHELPIVELERTGTWYFDIQNLKESVQFISISMALDFEISDGKITFKEK